MFRSVISQTGFKISWERLITFLITIHLSMVTPAHKNLCFFLGWGHLLPDNWHTSTYEPDQFHPIRHLSCAPPFKTINLKPLYIHVRANSPAISNIGHPNMGHVWLWNIHASQSIFLCCYLWSMKVIGGERKNYPQIFSLVLTVLQSSHKWSNNDS